MSKCRVEFLLTGLMLALSTASAQEIEEIVVIGTQIKSANIEGTLPVSIVDKEDIGLSAAVSGDELLRSIPQMGEVNFNESVTTGVNAARGDVNSINLRGLGTGNTLTLINGRRMVSHPGTQTENRIPVVTTNANTIPVAGIQRVEVLRDGAAALYGTDAVAGVINYVLDNDQEGSSLSLRYGQSSGTDLDEVILNGTHGIEFNNGQTRLAISGSIYKKNGLAASERSYSRNSDNRVEFIGDPLFEGDTSLDNRSGTYLGWGEFVYDGGVGRHHLRPTEIIRDNGRTLDADDCGFIVSGGLCLDPGGSDRALRQNRNLTRQLSPDSVRANVFAYLTHQLENGFELYSEFSYYTAKVEREREQAGLLSNGRFSVPADYYWNPLGPVTFSDGRVNPNRVVPAGDPTVPDEGLGFQLRAFTPLDTGLRQIEVEDESFRMVLGLNGTLGDWDFDTGLVYSSAETIDRTDNRVSHTLFQTALMSDQSAAYNIFSGLDLNDTTSPFDPTPNARSAIDPMMISVKREIDTSLTLWDFKLSNNGIFSTPAGEAGIALGVEWREEDFDENRDPRSDGSIQFTDLVTGEFLNGSDIVGSSASPDAHGSRRVISVFAELIVPLLADVPFVRSLDVQLAARHEHFSDVRAITKPKIALSWFPHDRLQFRAAYSEGFRAPNLTQTNIPAVTVVNTVNDPVSGASTGVEERRQGNENLDPEESKNTTYGVVFTPMDNIVLTLDRWKIEQDGVVGLLNADNAVLLDAILRQTGSSLGRLVRDPITNEPVVFNDTFQNQELREIEGTDLSVRYDLNTSAGDFRFKLNGAYIDKFDQRPGDEQQLIIDAGLAPNGAGSLIKQNGRPRWRATASAHWQRDKWGAGLFANYIGDFEDTSARADNDTSEPGKALPIEEYITVSAYVDYRFENRFAEDLRTRFGIRNMFDEEAKTADQALGYFGSIHSNRGRYVYIDINASF